jgi:hypothetical protein
MPSVKITELPVLSQLSNNTANTLFVGVDRTTNTTSKFTTATLAAGLFANSAVNVGTSIVFSDSSTQSVAAAPANYTQSAFNVANTAANNILIIQGVNTAQNSYAYAVNQYAEGAYAKANNALANTSGTFNGNLNIAGSVDITGVINPQKGFIYTPRVLPGAQTAITINFANDSVVRAQTSTGLTVTLSNLLAGKEVVAWITNTAGTTQTFTHGCSALNSTVNATTYGIPSTSTILVRYMSIDATAQNTFVAITHA